MVIRLIARDKVCWIIAALVAVLLAGAVLLRPKGPGVEGNAPLAGRQAEGPVTDNPMLHAVYSGTFPAVDSSLTLGKAFASYKWFVGEPKWLVLGGPSSRVVSVTAALQIPDSSAKMGLGSDAAAMFYVAEFVVMGDGASFRPHSSTVEVRDTRNKLLARMVDSDFTLIRRVMRGVEPVLIFNTQAKKVQ